MLAIIPTHPTSQPSSHPVSQILYHTPNHWTLLSVWYGASTMKKPPLVLITWDDAASDDGWESNEDYTPPPDEICYTVGYLLHKDRKSVEVAQTWSETQTGARWRVPRGMILKIEVLRK